MSHQFHAGQTVRLLRSSLRRPMASSRWSARFQTTAASVREPHERVVKESDLRRN